MNVVKEVHKKSQSYFINTGSPHHINFVQNVDSVNVFEEGQKIRHSEAYKAIGGTNVNFVEIAGNKLKIRTFERGVENETLACGTGATAAAIAYAHKTKIYNKEIKIEALGGILRLKFDFEDGTYKNIILSGPAEFVFNGNWQNSL